MVSVLDSGFGTNAPSGIINFVLSTIDYTATLFPDHYGDDSGTQTYNLSRPADIIFHWPTDYTADIPPVACHSHNDYWRPIPVVSAIQAGCTGVEADLWLLGDELYVGHSRSSLTAQRTFRSLYIEPLLRILDRQNPNTTFHPSPDSPRTGVFDTNSEQNLVLLIEFKTDGHESWRFVTEQLQPLRSRQYLTYFDGHQIVRGPLTVVVTGNAPFDKVIENFEYRDMFFDAPLQVMGGIKDSSTDEKHEPVLQNIQAERAYLDQYAKVATSNTSASKHENSRATPSSLPLTIDPSVYTPSNSYYTSTSFLETIGTPLPFLSSSQLKKIKAQIAGAHRQGLKTRYWDIPAWPIGLRNYVWEVLVKEGIDYLNVDDLDGATRGDWQKGMRGTIWSRKVSWHS